MSHHNLIVVCIILSLGNLKADISKSRLGLLVWITCRFVRNTWTDLLEHEWTQEQVRRDVSHHRDRVPVQSQVMQGRDLQRGHDVVWVKKKGKMMTIDSFLHPTVRDMGCTEVDKNECNVIKKGMAEEFSCFCKTDYCNSVSVLGPKPMMLLILTTIIVLLNG